MKKPFSSMYDRPKTELIITAFIYWFLCYVFVPFGVVLFTVGLTEETPVIRAWMEFGYHAVNVVLTICIMGRYLIDSSYNMSSQKKNFSRTVAFSFLLMVAAAMTGFGIMALFGREADIFHAFPIIDQGLFLMSDTAIAVLPLPSIICTTLFVPVTVCCLFYAVGFAPAACKHPLLGYGAIIILFCAFHAYEYAWHLDFQTVLALFLLRLPVHLIACRAYQKADTVWAPILSLGLFNLLSAVVCLLMG